jgi:hypothetical protein
MPGAGIVADDGSGPDGIEKVHAGVGEGPDEVGDVLVGQGDTETGGWPRRPGRRTRWRTRRCCRGPDRTASRHRRRGQHHRRHRRPTGHPPSPDLGCLSQTAVEASHLVHEPKVPSNSSASTLLRLGASFPERRSTDLDRGLWALFGSAGERASGRTMPMLLRGEVGGDGVGGVAVEVVAGAVVAACGARVGVAGGILDVTERGAGVEGGGYEGVA